MERTFNDFISELKELAARTDRNSERIQKALTLLESIEWTKQLRPKAEPLPPAPTPDAPDPGPGWRVKNLGELIIDGDQVYGCTEWVPLTYRGINDSRLTIRTPIYHNPSNLETAGEGYRFCLVSETRQDATEYWLPISKEWVCVSIPNGDNLSIHDTYRTNKPLPTT